VTDVQTKTTKSARENSTETLRPSDFNTGLAWKNSVKAQTNRKKMKRNQSS